MILPAYTNHTTNKSKQMFLHPDNRAPDWFLNGKLGVEWGYYHPAIIYGLVFRTSNPNREVN